MIVLLILVFSFIFRGWDDLRLIRTHLELIMYKLFERVTSL